MKEIEITCKLGKELSAEEIQTAALKALGLSPKVKTQIPYRIVRRSIDARNDILYRYRVEVYRPEETVAEYVLEEYKDNTVYLFFHTFMCGPDGEGHTGVGNLSNGKYEYDLPYTYGASDEARFRSLMQEYKNVVYFSGHSHWMIELDIYNPETNFSNFDGEYAYMVHIPSVTEPRYIGDDDSKRTGMNGVISQGWVVYDYGDTVVLVPVEFYSGEFMYEYMEIIHT